MGRHRQPHRGEIAVDQPRDAEHEGAQAIDVAANGHDAISPFRATATQLKDPAKRAFNASRTRSPSCDRGGMVRPPCLPGMAAAHGASRTCSSCAAWGGVARIAVTHAGISVTVHFIRRRVASSLSPAPGFSDENPARRDHRNCLTLSTITTSDAWWWEVWAPNPSPLTRTRRPTASRKAAPVVSSTAPS